MSETNKVRDKFKLEFGKRLRELMEKPEISPLGRKVTQVELAEYINKVDPPCSRQIVYRYEYGEALPDLYRVKLIADFFKVTSYDYFLCGSKSTQKENVIISKETGLSDEAINSLSTLKIKAEKEVEEGLIDMDFGRARDAQVLVNHLLKLNNIKELAKPLWNYVKTIQYLQLLKQNPEESGVPIGKLSRDISYHKWGMLEELRKVMFSVANELIGIEEKDKDEQ